jgi:hypothetical protein
MDGSENDKEAESTRLARNASRWRLRTLIFPYAPSQDDGSGLVVSRFDSAMGSVEGGTRSAADFIARGADLIDRGVNWAAQAMGYKIAPSHLGSAIRNGGAQLARMENSAGNFIDNFDGAAMFQEAERMVGFNIRTGAPKSATEPGGMCKAGVQTIYAAIGVHFKQGDALALKNELDTRPDFQLIKTGFGLDTSNYVPQVGDICCWNKEPDGHVAVYLEDKEGHGHWCSDCIQKNMAGLKDPNHPFSIYRYLGPEPALVASNAQTGVHGSSPKAHNPTRTMSG